MDGYILNKLNRRLVELILSVLMLMRLREIGNKRLIWPELSIKHTNQQKKCIMSKCWKSKSKLVKQWKNPKRTTINRVNLKTRKKVNKKKKRNNKSNMLKKLKK